MEIITHDLQGKEYTIVPCTFDDTLTHSEMVIDLIGDDERVDYIDRMRKCVEAGTAFKLVDDSAFLYYLNYEKCLARGYAIYGRNNPGGFIALLMGIFMKIDKNTFKLEFMPHHDNFIRDFKSITTMISLRRRNQPGKKRPLVIRIDELKKRLKPLSDARGISWEV